MIPMFAFIRVKQEDGHHLSLWLPLFLLWLLVLPFAVVILPIVAAVLIWQRIDVLKALGAVALFLSSAIGTLIEVESPRTSFVVRIA